jgi:hypothetical protein
MLPQQAHVYCRIYCGYRYHSAVELLPGARRFVNIQDRAAPVAAPAAAHRTDHVTARSLDSARLKYHQRERKFSHQAAPRGIAPAAVELGKEALPTFEPLGSGCRIRKGEQRHDDCYHAFIARARAQP